MSTVFEVFKNQISYPLGDYFSPQVDYLTNKLVLLDFLKNYKKLNPM